MADLLKNLPPLREDISLYPGPHDGQPSWILYDPALHRYLRIGWLEFEFLARWHLKDTEKILQSIHRDTTLRPRMEDLQSFLVFAENGDLLHPLGQKAIEGFKKRNKKQGNISWLLHHYLFLRIRLCNPDRFLTNIYPLFAPLFSRGFLIAIGALAGLGLMLIGRQWEAYTHSLVHLFTLEGACLIGIALSCSKIIHELGHGLCAKHHGCRVPSAGVALLVLWPVLWTDTTDGWRLTKRRQRLLIDSCGMIAEITLAIFASIAWVILPNGPLRSAMFILSSSTWILTMFVNCSPFMRFDGYYILSDLLDFPNLQERGFALTRWWIREILFKPNKPPPERFSRKLHVTLLVYSICTWIYRFFLFMGIALLVYHIAFKTLGLFLMAVEIWYFIAHPILRELMEWIKTMKTNRFNLNTGITFGIFALLLCAFLVPWQHHVHAPALLRTAQQAILYTN